MRELSEANMQSNSLQKQQLMELELLRDDDKQKAQRECDAAVSNWFDITINLDVGGRKEFAEKLLIDWERVGWKRDKGKM